jgi:hypothetical protein
MSWWSVDHMQLRGMKQYRHRKERERLSSLQEMKQVIVIARPVEGGRSNPKTIDRYYKGKASTTRPAVRGLAPSVLRHRFTMMAQRVATSRGLAAAVFCCSRIASPAFGGTRNDRWKAASLTVDYNAKDPM